MYEDKTRITYVDKTRQYNPYVDKTRQDNPNPMTIKASSGFTVPPENLRYFFEDDGKYLGPFRYDELQYMADTFELEPDTIIEDSNGKKTKAIDIDGLYSVKMRVKYRFEHPLKSPYISEKPPVEDKKDSDDKKETED